MQIRSFADPGKVADAAARYVSECAETAIANTGRFTCALSGGSTPLLMFENLARMSGDGPMDWSKWELFQVDERILPRGHEDRNFTHLEKTLLDPAGVPDQVVHPMPVERDDLADAAARYARELEDYCGLPPVLDLVVLGLGSDGHTASLVPLDPVLHTDSAYVDVTGEYNGHRRMTLTYPVLNGARKVIWLVTGVEKADALKSMEAGDPALPASKVNRTHAVIFADYGAMSGMDPA